MKIRLVRATLLCADRQSDGQKNMTKLIVSFGNFAKASKNIKKFHIYGKNT